MSFQTELYTRLSGHVGLTALVSTRIYPVLAGGIEGSNPTKPYVVFSVDRHNPAESFNSAGTIAEIDFTIEVVGSSAMQTEQVQAQVYDCLTTWGVAITCDNRGRISYSDDEKAFISEADFTAFDSE